MKKILSIKDFTRKIYESEDKEELVLKRNEFNVLMASGKDEENEGNDCSDGSCKKPPTIGVIDLNPPKPKVKPKPSSGKSKGPLQKKNPNKGKNKPGGSSGGEGDGTENKPGKRKLKKKRKGSKGQFPEDENKEGKKNGKDKTPPSLPTVGQRVRLRNGEEAVIKAVHPNGDIEI